MVDGDVGCEAYTTILWGVLLSRESSKVAEAETVSNVEGNMCGTAMRGADARSWSKSHHARRERVGTWEISCLTEWTVVCPARVGKVRSRSRRCTDTRSQALS